MKQPQEVLLNTKTMETLTETEKAWITMMVQAYGMNEQTALSYILNK